ncbi:MAG: aspartate carbamoyltransferase [Spirochaetales bacterium]|nr:MAG: aspartate carbamoyltransferase [Spirochaetales bacterium]
MQTTFSHTDIISITDFTASQILYLCEAGRHMHDLEKSGKRYSLSDTCRFRSLASMFYEPSTRTRASFITAMRELGGQSDGFSGTEGTSVMKKETIRDTIMMMGANHFDVIVMRHPLDGSLQWAADISASPVINGGDGKNEHPTQALLDLLTLYMLNNNNLDGISIGFGGDLSHGRTIRSLSLALSHFKNITIRWAAEDFLGMPPDLSDMLARRNVKVVREAAVKDVMKQVQYYYMTRPQLERMEGISQARIIEMMRLYRIDLQKVEGLDVKILHPLPVNSEIAEIDYQVFFSRAQSFFKQAEFGIFMRKALLYEMLKDGDYIHFNDSLPQKLCEGNNRLPRRIHEDRKHDMFIDKITEGVVLDHLKPGLRRDIDDVLGLEDKGYSCITAAITGKKNPFLKTNLKELTERELKSLALLSPEPTVNYIRNGKVTEKFVYLLCGNTNCITRIIPEDVPPRFYNDEGILRCRYCRREYRVINRKVSPGELEDYRRAIPQAILPVEQH